MKRKEKKQYIENKIINAIIIDLEKRDLNEMSADEIAKNAGVSKRTLYKYFESKKEMYLGVVRYCFKELSEIIQQEKDAMSSEDPFSILECIGYNYLQYCLKSRAKCKAITSFNENDYNKEFTKQVYEITLYSNKFEISRYIKLFYQENQIKPAVSINSLALYLWSHVQGLATLMLSKKSWIEGYYQIDFEQLIKEHLGFSKLLLFGVVKEK